MTLDDMLEVEQLQYSYEQAYPLHRHDVMPELFVKSEETVFTIPSADDLTTGWETIAKKFREELFYVSANEDSYHTGWQIVTPLLWEEKETKSIKGIFPTFGHFVMNLVPDFFKPPYQVMGTSEMWRNRYIQTEDGWKITRLQAQFMMGQPLWTWHAEEDQGLAVAKKLREIPHPYLVKEGE